MKRITTAWLFGMAVSAAIVACRGRTTTEAPAAAPAVAPGELHEQPEHEPSDLDQPVEALFARTCEHRTMTFACDQCRYEVGVVKAPRRLFDEGLLATTTMKRERVAEPLLLTGEVRFDERRVTHVSVPAQGVIRKVKVMLGDKVKKGEPLVEVDSLSVGEAEGAYLEATASLRLARSNFQRQSQLRQESITSEKEYLQASQEYEAAQIRVEAALGKLRRMGAALRDRGQPDRAKARGRLLVRAPVDGTVLTMHAVAGELVKSEESLFTIGDHATVWVWADLYERDIAKVVRAESKAPLAAAVSVRAYPGEELFGTVDFISPAMDEASRTVKLRIEVPNADKLLLAGMFASVKLFLPGAEETTTLPRTAVLEDEGRAFIFILHHEDYYVRRPVKVGRAWAGRVEITSGLTGGETVVADGAFLLKSDVLRSKMGAGCAD